MPGNWKKQVGPLVGGVPLILAVVLTVSPPCPQARAQEGSKAGEKAYERLLGVLKEELKKHDATLTEEAEKALTKVLQAGVDRLAKDEFKKQQMDRAEENLKRLADDLVKRSDKKRIEEKDVKASLKALCPLYPFC